VADTPEAKESARRVGIFLIAVVLMVFFYVREELLHLLHPKPLSETNEALAVQRQMGALGTVLCACMFTSPLCTIDEVIRNRSTASLSLLMTIASVMCALLWTIYGLLIEDCFLWGSNLWGLMCSLVLVGLFCIFGLPPTSWEDNNCEQCSA